MGPCMCGDTQCPSCGSAQGTYRRPRAKKLATLQPVPANPLPSLICCKCGAESRSLICDGCWHEHSTCCRAMPAVGYVVVATGLNHRAKGERHEVTRIMPSTIWTKGLTPGSPYFGVEDFVGREIWVETFGGSDGKTD